ncbi:hypothetical protein SK74_04612, partial [Escherichia coli]
VDRRRAKNGDNEYMAWDMTLGWIVWQQRAGIGANPRLHSSVAEYRKAK